VVFKPSPRGDAVADIKTDEGFFSARDGLRLYYRSDVPQAPVAHVVLQHGYLEHLGRQVEITNALLKANYAVHRMDCRGHGQSAGKRAFIEKFDEYVSDLDLQLSRVQEKAAGKPIFLLGHSNGALIVIRYLLDKPGAVRGAILSSPYLRLKLPVPALKVWAGKLIAKVYPSLPMSNELKPEQLMRDVALQQQVREDPLYLHHATPGWFVASTDAQATVLRRASEFVTPFFALHGGADPIADPAATREFAQGATSKDKLFKQLDGLLHETFHEPERDVVFKDVVSWLDERRAAPAGQSAAGAGA
jgi:alpha-beta hydrolase superfamily lysophospholipase